MIILSIFWHIPSVLAFSGNTILKDLGEKEYSLIKVKSTLPRHGKCWHDTLMMLQASCDRLNDSEHVTLALRLTNCFLVDSGHIMYDCHLAESETKRRECINLMSDRAFSVYNEFYVHATNICFFLKYEAWQMETESMIEQLYRTSSMMKDQLIEASKMQGAMLESQKEGLKMQNELLDHGKELETVLKTSQDTVNDMVYEFKQTAQDQKELLHEIFSFIRAFQNWIIGEVSWLQSIIYYVVSCIICALFSSTKSTVDARTALFTILSLNVIVERMLIQYYGNTDYYAQENKISLINAIWSLRKASLGLCAIILFCTYYYYKDAQIENHKTLQRIEQRLNMIQDVNIEYNSEKKLRYSKRLAAKRSQAIVDKVEESNKLSNYD